MYKGKRIEKDDDMIKLLIVDDESAIRNGLMKHVDWDGLGVGMVQSAASAQEALASCEMFEPDIVLSDIRMRGMGGIEMCGILREKYPDCRIIFVSGYADKEYLKAAISLGAVDYIEKPVSPPLLSAAVRKAVEACRAARKKADADATLENSRALLGPVVLRALALQNYPDDFEKTMRVSGLFAQPRAAYRLCVLRAEKRMPNVSGILEAVQSALCSLPMAEDSAYDCTFLDDRTICVLLSGTAETIGDGCAFLTALRAGIGGLCPQGIRFFLSVGETVSDVMCLHKSYEDAVNARQELFFKGYGSAADGVCVPPYVPLHFDKASLNTFASAFVRRDEKETDAVLKQIYAALLTQTKANPEQIRDVYYTLDYLMHAEFERRPATKEAPGNEAEAAAHSIGRMQGVETLENLNHLMRERAHRLIDMWHKEEDHCSAVLQVMRLMRSQYGDKNLSVKSLAESVYLTPTYLSGLFKKRTGKTIGQFLTEIRIEHSMELLMDKQLKLYHIAEMVGYEDPNYYAKIFKRHVGVTPSEYRETKLQ